MISAAFTFGFILISVIIVLIPTLMGIKRGTVKAGIKLAASLLAALISFIVCKSGVPKFKIMFIDLLKDIVSSQETLLKIVESIEDGTVLMSVAVGLAAAILLPFVFVILYVILNAILSLIVSIVLMFVKKGGTDLGKVFNLGWAIGLVHGLVTLVILMMPLVGILNLATSVFSAVNNNSNAVAFDSYYTSNQTNSEDMAFTSEVEMITIDGNKYYATDKEYVIYQEASTLESTEFSGVEALSECVPVKIVGSIGANALYRSLTTFKVDGIKISLTDEISCLANCLDHVLTLTETDLKNYSSRQAQALRLLSYDIQQSELTMLLVGDILPDMSQNWLDDKEYLGIKPPAVGKDLDPLVDKILDITAKTDRDTVKEDVASIFEIFAIIFDHETLKHVNDTHALMDNLSTKGYISKLLAATYANERMSPLVVEITNLGIRAVGNTLKIPEDNEAVYDNLMKDICAVVNKTSSVTVRDDRQKEIYDSLENSFADAGVKTTEDERAVIAYYLIDQFGARNDVSYGEIEEFFEAIEEGFEKIENTSFAGDVKFEFTSSDFSGLSDKIYEFYSGQSSVIIKIKTDDGYACFESTGDVITITKHSVDDHGNHVVDTLEAKISDKKEVFSNLSSSKGFECEGKTIENMLLKSTEGIDKLDAKDALKEFENLETGITKIVEFMNKVENNNGSKIESSSVEMLGDALQELSSNKLLGNTSCDFIEGALKSEFVQDKVEGLDKDIVNDVMVNLRNEDGKADPDFSLGNTLASGVEAAELVTQLGKDNGETDEPNEEVERSLTWLIENMSPSSAKMICKIITPTFIRERGLANGDLNHIADMLKELFMQMAQTDSMSEEEYKNETKAIQNLYRMMLKATSENSESVFDPNNKDGITAESVISNYMNSKVISQTVYAHAFKNGDLKVDFLCFGSNSMKAEDKDRLANAAVNYYKAHKNSDDPMFKDKLRALAAMVCVELEFVGDDVKYSFPETPGMNPLEYNNGHYTYKVNGRLVKGWTEINGKLYYFDSKGYAAIGWTTIKSERYYFTVETGARTGIVSIDDVLYAFDSNGALINVIG